MRSAPLKLTDLKPGRQYFAYIVPNKFRENNLYSILQDSKIYRKIYSINTSIIPREDGYIGTLISNSVPTIDLGMDKRIKPNYYKEDKVNRSITGDNYFSIAYSINGSFAIIKYYPQREDKDIFPAPRSIKTGYWGFNISNSQIKIFDNYLDTVKSIISDIEEILEKYSLTTEYLKGMCFQDVPLKPKGYPNTIDRKCINDYKDRYLYYFSINTSICSRIVDYMKLNDRPLECCGKVKIVNIKGNSEVSIQTETGEIIENIYIYSHENNFFEDLNTFKVAWNYLLNKTIECRELNKVDVARLILDKYKKIIEKNGKKLKEYNPVYMEF